MSVEVADYFELYKNKKGYIYILDGFAFKFDEYCNDFVSEELAP